MGRPYLPFAFCLLLFRARFFKFFRQKIEEAAQAVLDARIIEEKRCEEKGQKCSLATMYAANNMPEELLKAHKKLDAAVDAAYNFKGKKDDAARVAFLFEKYQELVAPMVEVEKVKKRRKSAVVVGI